MSNSSTRTSIVTSSNVSSNESSEYNVIIIGSGPAAYTAGIYTARANLNPLILEGEAPGGQLTTTTSIENYPGFSKGIDGYELMQEMREQCINAKCHVQSEYVVKINFQVHPYLVKTVDKEFYAKSIIIATGAEAKKLKLSNGDKFWGKGISACATCDGPLPFFRNKPIAVVGGGDTACEEALHLSKFGSIIYMFVRGDKMRASKIMQNKVLSNTKINIIYNTEILDAHSNNEFLEKILIINKVSNEIREINVSGLFYGIGHQPNTAFLDNQLELDNNGYIKTKDQKGNYQQSCGVYTNIKGVFAAGDVQDHIYRQAITAAGSGCMAALECERFLESND